MAFAASGAAELDDCEGAPAEGFRWLHLNLADLRTRQWIERAAELPREVRELLLAPDTHQRSVVDRDSIGCVLHDFERDFEKIETDRVGAIRVAITPRLVVTTRLHPIRSADIVRRRLRAGLWPDSPAAALELQVGAVCQSIEEIARSLERGLQATEDAFLEGRDPPTSRSLIAVRRRLAEIHRMLDGTRAIFKRLERDGDLPEALLPVVEKLSQRLAALDGDILGVQGQLRQLRDEIDIQTEQRTNQNLYLLSIITALLLPPTLVTSIFGMNTGGMPLQGPGGTLVASLLAASAAAASYALLRWLGFTRR
jgi:zinc transporter